MRGSVKKQQKDSCAAPIFGCCLLALLCCFAHPALAGSNLHAGRFHLLDMSLGVSAEIGQNDGFGNVIDANRPREERKSVWAALGYAVFPGYFIPMAFGHAYAEAYGQATAVSAARLAGRIMWMHAFFDNVFVQDAHGEIGNDLLFYAGLLLDLGGYIYDIVHAPIEVAQYNRRVVRMDRKFTPFIDIAFDGPCCGIKFRF